MTDATLTPAQFSGRNPLATLRLKTGLEIGGGLPVIAGLYLASLRDHSEAELFQPVPVRDTFP